MPTFSIIIPVYNVAPYLRECLDSVLAQTYADWEAICVDDGSSDGSGAILDEYAAKDNRFRVLHQTNAGVSVARNAALNVAKGEWFTFVDGDDIIVSNALLIVMRIIHENSSMDMVRHGHFRFSDSTDTRTEMHGTPTVSDLSKEIGASEMQWDSLLASQNVFRRSVCGDVRFLPFVCGEDRLYTFDCLQRARCVIGVRDCLYGYRARPNSYTTDVVKSFRGHEGELAYRMEFLRRMSHSSKEIHVDGADWLIRYLVQDFHKGFMQSRRLTNTERRKLFVKWREALHQLRKCQLFASAQRMRFSIQLLMAYAGSYYIESIAWWLRYDVFGPTFFLRKIYRRIMGHGEFSVRV